MKILKNIFIFFLGGGGGGRSGRGVGWGGVKLDVKEELKICEN